MCLVCGLSITIFTGTVDCFHDIGTWLSDSMFIWHVMACCENCFVGIFYATISLANRVVFAHV